MAVGTKFETNNDPRLFIDLSHRQKDGVERRDSSKIVRANKVHEPRRQEVNPVGFRINTS